MRVLQWIARPRRRHAPTAPRTCSASARATTTCTGTAWTSRASSSRSVIGIDRAAWQQELELHDELFQHLAYHLPAELPATKARIEERLAA